MSESTSSASQTARLELVEARAAIADLVHGYALNIRKANAAECIKLFTEDAVMEVIDAPLGSTGSGRTRDRLVGHDAILGFLTRVTTGETRICPMIHNLIIDVNGQDATSNCVMMSVISNGGGSLGEYRDRYRFDEQWRFCSRLFTRFSGQV